ncbi:MAG: HEAT repeat domain-containing protein [Elusimicrobiota bacterium]
MKHVMMFLVMVVAGYFAFQQFKPKPLPPPPPPPPAILLEPAPVISEEEQSKIIKSANDQDPLVRWESILFLDKMKAPAAYQVMFEKLHKDMDQDLRLKICNLLADRKGPEISQNLVWVTKDNDPDLRVAALKALEKIGDYATASAITDNLRDPDERVRLQALKTLNTLQDKKAAEILMEQKRQEDLRRQAEEAARRR